MGKLKILFTLACLLGGLGSIFAQTSPCLRDTAFHIVVLGSSTAAGAGASVSDSAWVNRYRNYLQSLNPAYQVTNRAVGGFTTYRLMPTGYVAPSNRPTPDTTHNITYAISLNPDAIIVNLPSNDVSSGFTVQEQLDNFDTIVNRSAAANIPIWVTTTQPKNYNGNATSINKQIAVRDSLYARYNPFVIDFWTTLADSSSQLATLYNSGDGTHLNDAGHGLVASRAIAADLPSHLYTAPAYVDYVATEIFPGNAPICGDPLAEFHVVLYNRGQSDSGSVQVDLLVENLSTSATSNYSNSLASGLGGCQEDTLTFNVNTSDAGNYQFTAFIVSSTDSSALNDTVIFTGSYLGTPSLVMLGDTGCTAVSLTLQAQATPGDSIRWFDAAVGGNVVGTGPSLVTPALSATTTYYAEALRGDFEYHEQLEAGTQSSINYNGTMFDLVADSTLVLDSFAVKVNTLGAQNIVVHTRVGSHLGYETNSAAWTAMGSFAVQVVDPNVPVTFATGGWNITAGDTLAIYFQMQNSSSNLSYNNAGQAFTRSTPGLQMITGSGAGFNFGGNFYPRDWNGEVYYHYGSKPDADCQSGRMPVEAVIGGTSVDLGVDTILAVNSSYTLTAGAGQAGYSWSTGATTPSITLDGNVMGAGIYVISVTVSDSAGCTATDEVIVVFAPLVSIDPAATGSIVLWPNPAIDQFKVQLPDGNWDIQVMDVQGRTLLQQEMHSTSGNAMEVQAKHWAKGIYLLEARQDGLILRQRFLKQ